VSERWSLAVELPRVDPIRTEVTLIVDRADGGTDSGCRMEGRLRGPICDRSTMLPLSVSLVPISESGRPGDCQRAGKAPPPRSVASPSRAFNHLGAVLNEPAFWTPELPALYELAVSVIQEGVVATADGPARFDAVRTHIGLRRLWAEGRTIRLDGRRIVIRGVAADHRTAIDPARPPDTSLVLPDPGQTAGLAEAADRSGCLLVVRCTMDDVPAAAALARRHPSVGFLIAASPDAAEAMRVPVARSRGMVGLQVDATQPPPPRPIPADFLVAGLPGGGLPHPAWIEPPPLPVLASRPGEEPRSPRAACDRLQADLAGWATRLSPAPRSWDWSGYLIESRGRPASEN